MANILPSALNTTTSIAGTDVLLVQKSGDTEVKQITGTNFFSDYYTKTEVDNSTWDWTDINNTPTTIAGYGITDAYDKTEVYTKTEIDTNIYTKTETDALTWAWGSITSTPTTIAGYGITDVSLDNCIDTNVSTPADQDVLVYDNSSSKWVNGKGYTPQVISVVGDPADTSAIPLNTINPIVTWVADIPNPNYTFDSVNGTITIGAGINNKLVRIDWTLGGTNSGTNRVTLETYLEKNTVAVKESSNYVARDGTNARGGISGYWIGTVATSDSFRITARTITTALNRDGIACTFSITTLD